MHARAYNIMFHVFTSVHTCVKYTYICIYPTPREWRNWVVWLVQGPGNSYLFVLCVHTYVCMCVMLTCISICLILHIHAYICIRIDVYVWIYAYKYEYTCKYVFTYIRQAPGDEGIQSHGTEKAGTCAYIHNKICAYAYIYIHMYQKKKRHSHLHICSFILQAADDEGIQSYGMGKAEGMRMCFCSGINIHLNIHSHIFDRLLVMKEFSRMAWARRGACVSLSSGLLF